MRKKVVKILVIVCVFVSFGFSGVANSAPCFGEDCFTGDIMRINPSEYLCDVSGSYSITILDEYKWWDDYYEQYVYDVEFCVSPYTTYGAEDLVYAYGEPMWNYGGEPVWWDGNEVGHYAGHFGQGFCGQGFDEDRFSVVTRQLPKTYDIYVEVAVQYSYYPDPFKFFTCYNPVGSITINEDETIDVDEPVFIINGECGSYDGEVFTGEDWPDGDYCSMGTFSDYGSIPYDENYMVVQWKCLGSDGGTDANCSAYYAYGGGEQSGCGVADGQVYSNESEPSEQDLCLIGEAENYYFDDVSKVYNWECVDNDFRVSCSAYSSHSVMFPDFDFDDWDFDFEEDETSKNWLVEIFKFVFLPKAETISSFVGNFNLLKTKVPLGYVELIKNKFKDLNVEDKNLELKLNIFGDDMVVFDSDSFLDEYRDVWDVLQNLIVLVLWFTFVIYLVFRGITIFRD